MAGVRVGPYAFLMPLAPVWLTLQPVAQTGTPGAADRMRIFLQTTDTRRICARLSLTVEKKISRRSHVKQEVQDIPVFDNVFFALGPHFAGFLGALLAFMGNKIFIGNGLGANKATFKVCMNRCGGARSGVAYVNCPGTHFLDACGKVGLQTEQAEGGTNHSIQSWLIHAHVCQKYVFVLIVQIGDLGFDGGAYSHD